MPSVEDSGVGALRQRLDRRIASHRGADLKQASEYLATTLSAELQKLGTKLLLTFPPELRRAKVKDVWAGRSIEEASTTAAQSTSRSKRAEPVNTTSRADREADTAKVKVLKVEM